MIEKNNLFPIGVLSKLTGAHIRCLRYYEQLGILTPAFVDKETAYRYYNYRQMRIVEAIQYCVELDIPLKKFKDFLYENEEQIDYEALIAYGKKVTDEKMKKILNRQRFIEEMNGAMAHAEKCYENGEVVADFDEKYLYCTPYKESRTGNAFQTELVKLIDDLEKNGLFAGYDNGLLLYGKKDDLQSYLFVEIRETDIDIQRLEKVLKMPKGKYLCSRQNKSSIEHSCDIFKEQFFRNRDIVVIETELFVPQYPYVNPMFELRCFVDERNI